MDCNPNRIDMTTLLPSSPLPNKPYRSIVVLTGAGISAESGIKTFRAADGLWEDHAIEDVATPEAFTRNPELVQRFYNQRRRQLLDGIEPNLAHLALADFVRGYKGELTLITQNIDNLHEKAGNPDVIHMHGELLKSRCIRSGQLQNCLDDLSTQSICPCCERPGTLRPHIVWFGEMPLSMDLIHQSLARCDLFVAIGTSGNVYPAAGFFQLAKQAGADTLELNLESSVNESAFDYSLQGLASLLVPTIFKTIKNDSRV